MKTTDRNVLARIRAEYLEMPGLTLTAAQLQRLCGVDASQCVKALDALVDDNFLQVKANGTYTRTTEGAAPRLRMAKAGLKPPVRTAVKR